MNLLVVDDHAGEGVFPLFSSGTSISNLIACKEYPHWFSTTINGYETFVPDIYVSNEKLNKDYNPTELIVKKGQIVTLVMVIFEWFYVKDINGAYGWLPASKVISI